MLYLAIILILLAVFSGKIDRIMKVRNFKKNGIEFDGYIIGVARKNRVIDAQELDAIAFSGSKEYNITGYYPGNRGKVAVEECDDVRVKISFVHPATGLPTKIRTILKKGTYRDSRIFRSAVPHVIKLDMVGVTILKHNHRLLSTYKQDVNSRNISKEEKLTLLKNARKARRTYYAQYYARPRDDWEGYDLIHPTIPIQGYLLDGDFLFIQSSNIPPLEDWTKDLQ